MSSRERMCEHARACALETTLFLNDFSMRASVSITLYLQLSLVSWCCSMGAWVQCGG